YATPFETEYRLTHDYVHFDVWGVNQLHIPSCFIGYDHITSLVINGGKYSNHIAIESTPATTAVTINTGSGTNVLSVSPNAQNLNDIAGSLTINGQAGQNTLIVNDQSNADSYYLNPWQAPYTFSLTSTSLSRSAYTPWYLGNGIYIPTGHTNSI